EGIALQGPVGLVAVHRRGAEISLGREHLLHGPLHERVGVHQQQARHGNGPSTGAGRVLTAGIPPPLPVERSLAFGRAVREWALAVSAILRQSAGVTRSLADMGMSVI